MGFGSSPADGGKPSPLPPRGFGISETQSVQPPAVPAEVARMREVLAANQERPTGKRARELAD